MKKIVGILGTVALLTSSIFAADVSAKVNLDGSLFNYNSESKTISALKLSEGKQNWNPIFQMSVNGDNAGASMSFYDSGADTEVKSVNYSVWFKPIDWLKVTVGGFSTNLNQETIDFCNTKTGIDSTGYALSLSFGGFSADAFFAPGWSGKNVLKNGDEVISYEDIFSGNFDPSKGVKTEADEKVFFKKVGNADATFAEFYGKLAYAADFGTVNAYINTNDGGKGNRDFGIGYANTFGSVNFFTNVIMWTPEFKEIKEFRAEVFAGTGIDSFGVKAFLYGGAAQNDKNKKEYDPNFGAIVKLTYGIGGYTPYIYLKDENFLADKFGMEAKIGCTGNLGIMSWDAGINMNFGEKNFTLDVPVNFSVSF